RDSGSQVEGGSARDSRSEERLPLRAVGGHNAGWSEGFRLDAGYNTPHLNRFNLRWATGERRDLGSGENVHAVALLGGLKNVSHLRRGEGARPGVGCGVGRR